MRKKILLFGVALIASVALVLVANPKVAYADIGGDCTGYSCAWIDHEPYTTRDITGEAECCAVVIGIVGKKEVAPPPIKK